MIRDKLQLCSRKINKGLIFLSVLFGNLFLYPMQVFASFNLDGDKANGANVTVDTNSTFLYYYNNFFSEYKLYLNIFMGITMLLNIIILTYHITQLGLCSDNAQKKEEAMHNIVIASVCIALQGAVVIAMWILYFLSNPLASGAAQ